MQDFPVKAQTPKVIVQIFFPPKLHEIEKKIGLRGGRESLDQSLPPDKSATVSTGLHGQVHLFLDPKVLIRYL